MSRSFDVLSRDEKIEFWQSIENKVSEALWQCGELLSADIIEEVLNNINAFTAFS